MSRLDTRLVLMSEVADERVLRIKRLQDNLSVVRKIAGWTTEQLGNKIGISKQTISNLENNKNPLTFARYIATRTILDYEIETSTTNGVLPKAVTILLDSADKEFDTLKKF